MARCNRAFGNRSRYFVRSNQKYLVPVRTQYTASHVLLAPSAQLGTSSHAKGEYRNDETERIIDRQCDVLCCCASFSHICMSYRPGPSLPLRVCDPVGPDWAGVGRQAGSKMEAVSEV